MRMIILQKASINFWSNNFENKPLYTQKPLWQVSSGSFTFLKITSKWINNLIFEGDWDSWFGFYSIFLLKNILVRFYQNCQGTSQQNRIDMTYNPSDDKTIFSSKANEAKIFENHLNPVMLVFIRLLSLSTLRWIPICQGFSNFSAFLHHFVSANLSHQQHKG